jgi:hypothetical protein
MTQPWVVYVCDRVRSADPTLWCMIMPATHWTTSYRASPILSTRFSFSSTNSITRDTLPVARTCLTVQTPQLR